MLLQNKEFRDQNKCKDSKMLSLKIFLTKSDQKLKGNQDNQIKI